MRIVCGLIPLAIIGLLIWFQVRRDSKKGPYDDIDMAMLGVIPIVLVIFAVILAVLAHVFGW